MDSRYHMALIAAALGFFLSGPAPAKAQQQRSPWMINVGIGVGRGEFEDVDDGRRTYRDGAVPQIRFGRMLSSHLMVGLAYQGWVVEFDRLGGTQLVDAKLRRSLQNLTLGLAWFPASDGSLSGLYVRGGGGVGWAGTAIVPVVEGEPQGHGDRVDDHGISYMAEAGYEFRISRSAALGLIVSYNYLDIQGDIVRTAWFSSANFTLTLFF